MSGRILIFPWDLAGGIITSVLLLHAFVFTYVRPNPLSLISSMYTALSNSISEQLYGRAIFPASPNIAQVAKALQEQE